MFMWVRSLCENICVFICVVFIVALFVNTVHATDVQQYSDLISNSSPSERSNHTLRFTLSEQLNIGDTIRFVPEDGDFSIPAVNFGINNVELYIATSSEFSARLASSTVSSTTDAVSIVTGTSGEVVYTIDSAQAIPSGAQIELYIGTHTTNSTSTDIGILNPSTPATYTILIDTGNGNPQDVVEAKIAIIEKVGIADIDTTETIPPVRFNGAPVGELSGTVTNVEVSVETDEFAMCRYATASGTPYFSMTSQFSTTFITIHSFELQVATSTSYQFFVRCIDDEGNINTDDYSIAFSIPEFPDPPPGDTGTNENQGNSSSTGNGTGTNTGSTGSDSTSGSGSGGGGGGGGTSGGGGGGGNSGTASGNGGGFSGNGPYQSGDGRVIINGFAFPKSDVVVLVDGYIAEEVRANNTGDFTVTVDDIARGTYTFGIYAIDTRDTKSTTFSTSFLVTGGRGSTLSNINIMPSILVEPDPVDPGQLLTISGYSIPDADITIENQKDTSSVTLKTFTTVSDGNGFWSIEVDTTGFTNGTYKVRAKSRQGSSVLTNFSDFTFYGVGEDAKKPLDPDLNRDGSVNLIDFSILLFWWNGDGGTSDPPADINQDGKVSLTDFSIMIFNWTG